MTTLGPILAFIAALITATIAFLNYRFTIRNRTSSHRDALYKKQLETYDKIISLVMAVHYSVVDAMSCNAETPYELCQPVREILTNEKDAIFLELHKNAYHMDEGFSQSVWDYLELIRKISFGMGDYRTVKYYRSEDEVKDIQESRAHSNKERAEQGLPTLDAEVPKFTLVDATIEQQRERMLHDLWKRYEQIIRVSRKSLGVDPLLNEITQILKF